MLQDRAQLHQEQEQFDKANSNDPFDQQAREERLRQFHALRAQEGELGGLPTHPATAATQQQLEAEAAAGSEVAAQQLAEAGIAPPPLTLTQQVQKTASAQRQQQEEEEQMQALGPPESVWGIIKQDHAMPQPFPPPPSASPLPAPAAQRNRQYVAESLAAGSRSHTQTPVDAPATSVAPWAKEAHDLPKGPSLKEIQEAEARKAAQREEIAAAARRAQLLAAQERLSQAQAQVAPGLPSSANWASAGSPATPTSAGSVWSSKTLPVATNTATKKTLAQIQKEEEARKQRLVAAAASAAQTATPSPPMSAGKRYADLASKAPAPVAPGAVTSSGAWTTVGASGKAKAPPNAPLGPRSVSGTVPTAPAVAAAKVRPATGTRTVTTGSLPQSNSSKAVEEFTKWAKLALGKGLNMNINGES
jgi:PERQ amino acid-rich with GYF domain-containing protein